ncbi:phage tail protein [Altericroceibacterium endophyticum]|uniref:Phage tail protein n=1 Tax=Altericroceibacterium endophyticum TaxID=1808508 RepID=A0A6I4T555_9SPHN|nr:phage tail protein [Altericroceibacterium endophyticum]MXO64845.1 hypothetical protein [Altericroceibacterium endophyticum]
MNKPDSLRAAFTAVFGDLADNPDRFRLWIEEGHVRCHAADPTQGENLSYTLEYRLVVVFEAWRRSHLLIWIVLLDWLRIHQPDLLTPKQSPEAIPFEADLISNEEADISFELMLSEPIRAKRRADGGFDMSVIGENNPLFPDSVPLIDQGKPLASVWLDGDQLL